ncbi:Sodium/proline symporter [Polystyrenella longa]|uniref:Sodium/proline symporter n=1 Tax=Polystyrenella longa TaxID=2528007 RepID=A0A518CP87_9PLAN|nr:sodium:solute symporter family protein [Polystyrenella longa]QDU81035.1 Sodium/proline symporter [Polystyrenella longa]
MMTFAQISSLFSNEKISFTIISGYLLLLLLLGLGSSRMFRGTSKDFMLASHSIGPFMLLMSIFGTTMTAFALVGSTGEAFKEGIGVYGMMASSSGIIHSLCFFILGVKLWKLGQKYGYKTQIQYFRDRLDSDKIGLVLFPVIVGLVIPYLLIGVMASGTVIFNTTRGAFPDLFEGGAIPKELASLAICCVVLVYVFFGGMRGTAWANTFQTLVFMVLGVITFVTISAKLGGVTAASEAVMELHPDKLVRTNIPKLQFFTYLFIPLSVGMFPHLFQHWLTARSASTFKLPVVAHPLFIMIVWVPCVLLGVWATSIMTEDGPMFAEKFNANAVLAVMVSKMTTPTLAGFLTAGILAAIMSSLDSQFLCVGTIFTEDMVVHYKGRDKITDTQEIWLARGFIVAIVALTYVLALFLQGTRIFSLAVWCFSGFSSLFPLILAALYWKRLTKAGAYACVIAAFASWLYLFAQADFAGNPDYVLQLSLGGEEYKMMPVVGMIACSTLALVIVSLFTKPPRKETLEKFFPEQTTSK